MTEFLPPVTQKIESERKFHGDHFIDQYEWLRDKESAQVLEHLTAENTYTDQVTASQEPLRTAIFEEIKERTLETDLSVPTRIGDWWYLSRTVEGEQYPVFSRIAASGQNEIEQFTPPVVEPGVLLDGETVVLDCNEFARDLPFFSLGSFVPSDDGKLLAFSVDDSGNELYTQYFLNLETGEYLADRIEKIFAGSFLTPDASALIYTRADDSWRPYQLFRHVMGTSGSDQLLLQEDAVDMWLGAENSSDRTALVIGIGNSEATESFVLPYDSFEETLSRGLTPVISRDERVLYEVEPFELDGEPGLLILHDDEAENSEIVWAPYPTGESFKDYRASFKPVMPHRETARVESFALSRDHLVVSARVNTTVHLFTVAQTDLRTALTEQKLPVFTEMQGFTEEIYSCTPSNISVSSPVVRFSYSSWVTPTRIYEYFPASEELFMRKETPVLGGFKAGQYLARREWATAQDGTKIPLSVIYKADLDLEKPHPVFQYGYGSYEVSMDPYFSIPRLSLLDRGVVYVVAHIRGGGEMGHRWYLDGKKLNKKNTFTDFVDSTDYIAAQPWADADRITIAGGSAGGLLIGAVLNLAPEKYKAAIASVPFVDALTTILDPDLPLSALEWEEWGNPIEDQAVYEYMKSYTPYENIRQVRYPAIVAITSLNDTRVFYVEPAKWIAQLRDTIDPASDVPLLKIEMDGGHSGGSGRYTRWRDIAWEYAFALTHIL